jgi:hypothetical protein
VLLGVGCTRQQIQWSCPLDNLREHGADLQYGHETGEAAIVSRAWAPIATDCAQAAQLPHGSTQEEQEVRRSCEQLGFPLPPPAHRTPAPRRR